MPHCTATRRQFLRRSAALAASGTLVPDLWTSAQAKPRSANDRFRLGAIGVGGQGSRIAEGAAAFADVVACCDVDRKHAAEFARDQKIDIYEDFRRLLDRSDIDVVTIGTPDHWHAAIALRALRSGKDVYCEKPLALTIDEGKLLRAAVQETGRVLQVGTQQRSTGPFLRALALIKKGRLGNVTRAVCSIGSGLRGGPFREEQPPPGLNWDLWLGQAPKVPYLPERCHYRFRWWLEYSGGKLTDWGAHHIDIAQWGLGKELTGPVTIEGQGDYPQGRNCFNTAVSFQCDLRFADGAVIHVRNAPAQGPWFEPVPLPTTATCPDAEHGLDNGIWFEGDRGRIFVNRTKLVGEPVDELTAADEDWLHDAMCELYHRDAPGNHMANFFHCVRQRRQPISDVFTQHRTSTSCHLCNIAMRLRRKLTWDPLKEDFIGDAQASALLRREQREGYTIRQWAGA